MKLELHAIEGTREQPQLRYLSLGEVVHLLEKALTHEERWFRDGKYPTQSEPHASYIEKIKSDIQTCKSLSTRLINRTDIGNVSDTLARVTEKLQLEMLDDDEIKAEELRKACLLAAEKLSVVRPEAS